MQKKLILTILFLNSIEPNIPRFITKKTLIYILNPKLQIKQDFNLKNK